MRRGVGSLVPSIALYHLLDSCKAWGMEAPKETGHIKCDYLLCCYLSDVILAVDQPIDLDAVEGAFHGDPVKQVWAVCQSILEKTPEQEERDLRLRRRAAKRGERKEAC